MYQALSQVCESKLIANAAHAALEAMISKVTASEIHLILWKQIKCSIFMENMMVPYRELCIRTGIIWRKEFSFTVPNTFG